MSNLIEIIEPVKKKGRPKQNLTPEQMSAKKERAKELKKEKSKIIKEPDITKILKKRGKKPKEYTEDEILRKIEHTKKYQREYMKKKYVSKKTETKGLNHCLAKKYLLKKEDI